MLGEVEFKRCQRLTTHLITPPGSERHSRQPWNFPLVEPIAVQEAKTPGCMVWIFLLQNVLKIQLKGLRERNRRRISQETVFCNSRKMLLFFSTDFVGQGRRGAKDPVGVEGRECWKQGPWLRRGGSSLRTCQGRTKPDNPGELGSVRGPPFVSESPRFPRAVLLCECAGVRLPQPVAACVN